MVTKNNCVTISDFKKSLIIKKSLNSIRKKHGRKAWKKHCFFTKVVYTSFGLVVMGNYDFEEKKGRAFILTDYSLFFYAY